MAQGNVEFNWQGQFLKMYNDLKLKRNDLNSDLKYVIDINGDFNL